MLKLKTTSKKEDPSSPNNMLGNGTSKPFKDCCHLQKQIIDKLAQSAKQQLECRFKQTAGQPDIISPQALLMVKKTTHF